MAMGILLIAIDQCIKVAVKLHMGLGEQIVVFDWFRIDFIENRGMAFGMEIGSKLLLSLFRIVAVGFIIRYIGKKIRQGRPLSFILILTMICARRRQHLRLPVLRTDLHGVGALWRARPVGGLGRGLCAHAHGTRGGHVLLPALPWHLPHVDAVRGGEPFIFFSPVFNFADACISVGVTLFLIFYRKELDAETHRS